MEAFQFDFRDASLILSLILWVMASATIVVGRRLNGSATLNLKLGIAALWLYASLRIYSASSYLWGPSLPDEMWPVVRAGVLTTLTLILIILGGLLAFYWRRMKKRS